MKKNIEMLFKKNNILTKPIKSKKLEEYLKLL